MNGFLRLKSWDFAMILHKKELETSATRIRSRVLSQHIQKCMKEAKSTRSNNQHNNMASNYMPTTHYNTPHRHTQNQFIMVDIPHATSHIIEPMSTCIHYITLAYIKHRTRSNTPQPCPRPMPTHMLELHHVSLNSTLPLYVI